MRLTKTFTSERNYTKLLVVNTLIFIGVLTTLTSHAQFITRWKTTADNEVITIPTMGSGYDSSVDWDDGSSSTGQTGNVSHTYTLPGTFRVSITGTFPRIYFFNTGVNKNKIIEISQWERMPGQVWGALLIVAAI